MRSSVMCVGLMLGVLVGGAVSGQPAPGSSADFQAQGETLGRVIGRLRAADPGRWEASRAVEWERVTLHAPGQSVREVAQGIGTLFGYLWSAEGGGRRVLVAAQRTRAVEQGLWQRALERMAAPLAEVARLTRTPASEYMALRQKEAQVTQPLLRENLYYLSRPASHAALQFYLTLTEAQRFELLANERLFVPWAKMDERQQELARQVARGLEPDEKQADEWIGRFGLVLGAGIHPVTGAVSGFTVGIGGPLLVCASLERSGAAPPGDLLPVRFALYDIGRSLRSPEYPDLKRAAFPAAFRLDATRETPWPEVVRELGRHLKQPLYSDDFTASPTPGARGSVDEALPQGASLQEGLDALCRRYGRLWWHEDGALYFRSRTWFLERLYEVPPPVHERLQAALAEKGKLDAVAVAELCALTPRQLQGLNSTSGFKQGQHPLRAGDSAGARTASEYLRIYALLTEPQRKKVLSETGLLYSELQPAQRQAFLEMLAIGRGRGIFEQIPTMRFRIEQSPPAPPQTPDGPRMVHLSFTYAEGTPVLGRLQLAFRPRPGTTPGTVPGPMPDAKTGPQ